MSKLKVGVLRGGISNEYEVSLRSGQSVLENLPEHKYDPFDIVVTRDGGWNINGYPTSAEKVSRTIDVVFNALHGEYGEDGKVQRILDQFNVPYTGSGSFASAMGMNKALSKYYFRQVGLLTPECRIVDKRRDVEDSVFKVFRSFPGPYIVKPIASGSSIGVSVARDYWDLMNAVKTALDHSSLVLVEEFIKGREITCAVVEGSRGNDAYALPPVEVVLPIESEFFDYDSKYSGTTKEVCPANLFGSTTQNIQQLAVRAHRALGLRHYSRSDFILSNRGVYILETNSLPGLTKESFLPKAIHASGSDLSEFVDYIIMLALKR